MKTSWTFDHPSDIGLEARADTLGELMEALAEGLSDVICDRAQVRPADTRTIKVSAEDPEALAVDFLSAVMNLIQTRHFLVACGKGVRYLFPAPDPNAPADEMKKAPDPFSACHTVIATLAGETYDPARHEIKIEVKAVTYHQLKIAREGDHWTGRVILDI